MPFGCACYPQEEISRKERKDRAEGNPDQIKPETIESGRLYSGMNLFVAFFAALRAQLPFGCGCYPDSSHTPCTIISSASLQCLSAADANPIPGLQESLYAR